MGSFGTSSRCGHADFYPNDGVWQIGCLNNICNHIRVVQYFLHSFNAATQFIGTLCVSVAQALATGYRCSDVRDVFGIYSRRIPGTFYLETSASPPFALN